MVKFLNNIRNSKNNFPFQWELSTVFGRVSFFFWLGFLFYLKLFLVVFCMSILFHLYYKVTLVDLSFIVHIITRQIFQGIVGSRAGPFSRFLLKGVYIWAAGMGHLYTSYITMGCDYTNKIDQLVRYFHLSVRFL